MAGRQDVARASGPLWGRGFSQHQQRAGSRDVALAHYETKPNPGRTLGFGMDWLAALGFATRSSTAARVAGSPQGWGPSGKGNHGFDHRPCDRALVMRGSPVWEMASLSFLRGHCPPRHCRKTLSYNRGRCKNETGMSRG